MVTGALAAPRMGAPATGRHGKALGRRRRLPRLHQLVVNGGGGGAGRDELPRLHDLLVDDGDELLDGLRADEAAAVDEEVRRARGAHVVAEVRVLVEDLLVLLLRDGVVRLAEVEPHGPGDGVEIGVVGPRRIAGRARGRRSGALGAPGAAAVRPSPRAREDRRADRARPRTPRRPSRRAPRARRAPPAPRARGRGGARSSRRCADRFRTSRAAP